MMGEKDFENMEGIPYECVNCGHRFDGKELINRGALKCPRCGYKVLRKVRSPLVRRVKAE